MVHEMLDKEKKKYINLTFYQGWRDEWGQNEDELGAQMCNKNQIILHSIDFE